MISKTRERPVCPQFSPPVFSPQFSPSFLVCPQFSVPSFPARAQRKESWGSRFRGGAEKSKAGAAPQPLLWVPRSCVFCRGGNDAADSMRILCLSDCIAPMGHHLHFTTYSCCRPCLYRQPPFQQSQCTYNKKGVYCSPSGIVWGPAHRIAVIGSSNKSVSPLLSGSCELSSQVLHRVDITIKTYLAKPSLPRKDPLCRNRSRRNPAHPQSSIRLLTVT
jgi:hypothetical protein